MYVWWNVVATCHRLSHRDSATYTVFLAVVLELFEYTVYCDTDSIVYFDDGENTVKTGDMLGEWTHELKKNEYMKLWASTGPKSYYYETNLDKNVTKIKGFTLNYQNLEKLNGNTMKKIIKKEVSEIFCISSKEVKKESVDLEYNQITRDTKTKNLVNKSIIKKFQFEYDKRVILQNYDILPYGYYFNFIVKIL